MERIIKPKVVELVSREEFYSDKRVRTGAINPEGIGGTLPTKLKPFIELMPEGDEWKVYNPYDKNECFFTNPREAKKYYDGLYDDYLKSFSAPTKREATSRDSVW
jgi:hypothetical protein